MLPMFLSYLWLVLNFKLTSNGFSKVVWISKVILLTTLSPFLVRKSGAILLERKCIFVCIRISLAAVRHGQYVSGPDQLDKISQKIDNSAT